ncbi:MAG: ATP-binding protein [Elusimicrobia bacterium]|nr:ATP-binding protein [Elusimicrobiota bacterium]
MERWEIRASPGARDPDRHLLLIQGGPADTAALIKRFGALFGRPAPSAEEGFNQSLVIHRFKSGERAKLEAWLAKTCPPRPKLASAPATPPPAAARPAPAAPAPAPAPVSAPAAVPTPVPSPTPPAVLGASSLRPDWTFETLLVGAYNRFAHAAAMSAVAAPGSMYNPLFLYGAPGTGKSHFLNAIGGGLARTLGPAAILAVSGPRLSRAVDEALERGAVKELEAAAGAAKALLVDDIHLLAVSDRNKEALAGLFKSFFDRQLQVVCTSLYPPRALGSLEEALKISFSRGWSVDLKVPAPAAQRDLLGAAADRSGVSFSGDEIALLHEKLSQWGYQSMTLWLRRVAVLRLALESAGRPASIADVLSLIYEPILPEAGGGGAPPPSAPPGFQPPAPAGSAETLAVVVPQGRDELGPAAAALFYETAAKHIPGTSYRHVLWGAYDAAQPFGAPFLVGELCRRTGAARVLVVGPAPDSPLGPRAADFEHALRRILESFGARLGWLPFDGLRLPAHYLNARLDFIP